MDAGTAPDVSPGAARRFGNGSGADVHFIVVSASPSHGDRVDVEEAGAGA